MDKRLSFRFRLPWRNSPRPTEEPEPRPTPKPQNPAESTTTAVPVDRPPFRPAGKAAVKGSPSQAQRPKKTDPASSRAANESPKTPSKKSQPTTQQISPPSPASSQSEPVPEEAIAQPQKPRRRIEIISETDSSAEDGNLTDIFASSDKSDSDTLSGDQKQLSTSETVSKEHKEAEKAVQVPAVEEKTNDPSYTEPLQERVTQLHVAATDLGNQANDPLGVSLQTDRHEKQEKVTEPHAAAKDSENHTKDTLGVALQANQQPEKQEKVTELHAAAEDSGTQAKDPLGVASQADQLHDKQGKATEFHAAATDSENQNKDPIGVALRADQQHENEEKLTELRSTDSGNHTKGPLGVALQADHQHEKQEKVTEFQAAATDSGNHTKHPLGVALQAHQQQEDKVTEVRAAATDSEDKAKEPLGVALQTDHQQEKEDKVTEAQAAATDSGNQPKEPLGVALQGDQQHEKQEKVTDSGNHTKDLLGVASQADQRQEEKEIFYRKEILATTSSDEKPIKTERSSSRVSIRNMVASTTEGGPPSKEIKEDVSTVDELVIKQQMLDKPVGVVTLSGENRGAAMLLGSEPGKQEEPVHIRRGYKLNPDDTEATTDGEISNREEIFEDQMYEGDQKSRTYINSNVQSINNSIVFNSSVTERDPGVAVFSSNPPEPIASNKESDSLQTHKAQVVQTTADKHTHESTIRRRCLRGLFMESSDSEPDNPTKPRRHGCRYICGKERKETEIGIV